MRAGFRVDEVGPINPALFRCRIEIEINNRTRSEGIFTDVWETYTSAWARITAETGREFYGARELTSTLSHEISMYYQYGITTAMRVRFDDPKTFLSRYFAIGAIHNPDEKRRYLILQCTEIQGGQARAK